MASLSRKIRRSQSRKAFAVGAPKSSRSLEKSARRARRLGLPLSGALVLMAAPGAAWAGAGFSTTVDGNTTTYHQSAQKVFNEVDRYNIAAQETHLYQQPNRDSIFVQRVIGSDPSCILGQLVANGQVWLMNPSGVLIGAQARVNTSGFLATSLVMDKDDFFAGRYALQQEGEGGHVINQGAITVQNGGYAMLAGSSVVNQGTVRADMGEVVLASGKKMTFDFAGDGLINFAVDQGASASVTGPDGASLDPGALNAGTLAGARVTMTAQAANSVLAAVVNNEGAVEATRVETGEGGVIRLLAGDGDVENSGTLDASGTTGGQVLLSGKDVAQAGTIAADGSAGDGGRVDLAASGDMDLAAGSTISAKSAAGDGGEVRAIAQGDLDFEDGSLIDVSGADAQSGGFIETSGMDNLFFRGDVLAAGGTLLIDPQDVLVVQGAANTGGGDHFLNADDPALGDFLGNLSEDEGGVVGITITDGKIESISQAGTNVLVEATRSITILNLADNEITGGAGSLTFRVTGNGEATGNFNMSADDRLFTTGADITIDCDGATFLSIDTVGRIASNGGDVKILAGGAVSLQNTISTAGGDLLVTSLIDTVTSNAAADITTGAGTVTLFGGNDAVHALNLSGDITTVNAAINLYADTGLTINSAVNSGNATITISAQDATDQMFVGMAAPGAVPEPKWEVLDGSLDNLSTTGTLVVGDNVYDPVLQVVGADVSGNIIVGTADPAAAGIFRLETTGNIYDDGTSDTGLSGVDVELYATGANSVIGTFTRTGVVNSFTGAVGVDTSAGTITAATPNAGAGFGGIHLEETSLGANNVNLNNITLNTNAAVEKLVSVQVVPGAGPNIVDVSAPVNFAAQNIDLALLTDDITIGAAVNINGAGDNVLTIRAFSNNQDIRLGDANAGDLSLSDAELNQITADGLVIGSAGSGDVTLSIAGGGTIGPATVTDFTIISGGAISDDGVGGTETLFSPGTLTLDADEEISGVTGTLGTLNKLNVQALTSLAARTRVAGNNIYLYENDATGMDLGPAHNVVDAVLNPTLTAFGAHVDSVNNVVLESTGSIQSAVAVNPATVGVVENVNGEDVALYAVNGIGTVAQAIVTDVDLGVLGTGELAAVNTTTGGIFVTESADGGPLQIGDADVDGGAGPAVLNGVTNRAAVGNNTADVKIATTDGNLTIANGFWVDNDAATGQAVYLTAGDPTNADRTLTIGTPAGGSAATVFTNNGDVYLSGNEINIPGKVSTVSTDSGVDGQTGVVNNNGATGGNVLINPFTFANNVQVGGADPGAGTLTLTEAELQNINTAHSTGGVDPTTTQRGIMIGIAPGYLSTGVGGTISIASNVTLTGSPNYTNNLVLATSNAGAKAITDGSNGTDPTNVAVVNTLSVNQLALYAGGGIDVTAEMLDETGAGQAGALVSAFAVTGHIILDFQNSTATVAAPVTPAVQQTFFGGIAPWLNAVAGSVVVESTTGLTVSGGSSINAAGFVVLEANADNQAITLNGAVTGGNEIYLIGDSIAIAAQVNGDGGDNIYLSVDRTGDNDDAIHLGNSAVQAADVLAITETELELIGNTTPIDANHGVVIGLATTAADVAADVIDLTFLERMRKSQLY